MGMEINRIEYIKKLDVIVGLIRNLKIAIKEEPEKLDLEDIKGLMEIIESKLIDTKNWLRTQGDSC